MDLLTCYSEKQFMLVQNVSLNQEEVGVVLGSCYSHSEIATIDHFCY